MKLTTGKPIFGPVWNIVFAVLLTFSALLQLGVFHGSSQDGVGRLIAAFMLLVAGFGARTAFDQFAQRARFAGQGHA